jgi:hypothetical protein
LIEKKEVKEDGNVKKKSIKKIISNKTNSNEKNCDKI